MSARAVEKRVPCRDVVVADDRDLARDSAVISVTEATSRDGRVLFMIAKSASIISAKRTACFARPASGATTRPVPGEAEIAEVLCEQRQRRHVVDRDREEPLNLSRMRSIVSRRSAPDAWIMSASNLLEIGSRGFAFRSCREYGNHGITA